MVCKLELIRLNTNNAIEMVSTTIFYYSRQIIIFKTIHSFAHSQMVPSISMRYQYCYAIPVFARRRFQVSYIIRIILFHHHHHHHIVPPAWISLTLSRHFSLSFIAFGRSSGLHPVSSHCCCMYVRAGRPAFAWPYAGVHRSTSLMSSSLLLQQCPACLVRLT